MPGSFFNSLIYKALGGMARRKNAWLRVRIPRSPPYLIDFVELIPVFFCRGTILGPNAQNPQSLRYKLRHPGRICGDPLPVMFIDHSRAGVTHLTNDPFLRDAGGEQLANECVPCSARPAIAYLGFF